MDFGKLPSISGYVHFFKTKRYDPTKSQVLLFYSFCYFLPFFQLFDFSKAELPNLMFRFNQNNRLCESFLQKPIRSILFTEKIRFFGKVIFLNHVIL